jgi:putative phosphoesterase
MKIAIISDIHGNFDALSALPENYDELWVLGDLVGYGPQPSEVVDFVRSRASTVVRGNHDHAAAFGDDPRCSPRFRDMAAETLRLTQALLGSEQTDYLRGLPRNLQAMRGGTSFQLCHAVPTDPLYCYCEPNSDRWKQECAEINADFLFVGHTHIPFIRKIAGCTIVNPGSLGQPKTGSPEACYAVWEDGKVELRRIRYPVAGTVAKIRNLGVSMEVQRDLITLLESGSVPPLPRRELSATNS